MQAAAVRVERNNVFEHARGVYDGMTIVNALIIGASMTAITSDTGLDSASRLRQFHGFVWSVTLMLNSLAMITGMVMLGLVLQTRHVDGDQTNFGREYPVFLMGEDEYNAVESAIINSPGLRNDGQVEGAWNEYKLRRGVSILPQLFSGFGAAFFIISSAVTVSVQYNDATWVWVCAICFAIFCVVVGFKIGGSKVQGDDRWQAWGAFSYLASAFIIPAPRRTAPFAAQPPAV